MKSVSDIRQAFLDYFAKHDHKVVPSSSLVPSNDPTLLFTSAGMVQFKNVFTGIESRDYVRAVTSQKCVRAGGKHNDLENVGHTARHHTFFEMLGNFSFGDYFKDIAIQHAWNLLTKEFGLPPKKLLVTVYGEDEEAAKIWKKVTSFGDEKIIRINTADNFWSMGATGPCGPCSEIFYDHGEKIPGGPPGSADEEGDRFVEIWNLVFMQYEQLEGNIRRDLPKPSIDTGMGLERIAAVLQGKHDNYDIDLFKTLIQTSMDLSGTKNGISHRVLADHLRSSCFLIADGVTPSNEGRGYVLRRIMRRAMRHVHMLGCKEPLMYKLVSTLVEEMGHAYPELTQAEPLITETLRLEEDRFRQTLEKGLRLLEDATNQLPTDKPLPGEIAFKLYDTYGFPIDLTQDVLKSQNRSVDMAGFNNAMAQQKALARASWVGSGETTQDQIWFDLHQRFHQTEFLGYDTTEAEGLLIALVKDGKEIKQAQKGDRVQFLTNQTPFYAESGGQIGDTGEATTAHRGRLKIIDTVKKVAHLHVHEAEVIEGPITLGETLYLNVDGDRRTQLRAHHSATHLLHQALRLTLGEHVTQKGSLVAPDRLRFDFSYPKPLTPDEIQTIEDLVNKIIRHNTATQTHLMKPDEAIKAGALALFGEKYGDEVRVVRMGEEDPGTPFSTELCGGTHVHRTGDIGYFKIISETGIAAGVRRIEALAGVAAEKYCQDRLALLSEVADILKTRPSEAKKRLEILIAEKKKLEKDMKKALEQSQSAQVKIISVGETQFAGRIVEDVPPKDLKPMADALKKQVGSGIVAIAGSFNGKASLVVGVTPDLTRSYDAVELVKTGAASIGGKGGGGRPDMAQAGGSDVDKLQLALDVIKEKLEQSA